MSKSKLNPDPERDERGLRKYALDYIPDKSLFSAVQFSLNMIRNGKPPGIAHKIASRYYGVPFEEVSKRVSQIAGTVSGWRGHRRAR